MAAEGDPVADSVAVGSVAVGSVAVGSVAVGSVAVGSVAVGSVAVGSVAVGSVAVGSVAVGSVAVGSVAVGSVAVGSVAVGSVAVVGSLNIDHVVIADRFPARGETIMGRGTRTSVGGKGANQAVAAALAGARVSMIGRVGSDADGTLALDALRSHGVDVGGVAVVDGMATGTAWITVADADNTIIVIPGANHSWSGGTGPDAGFDMVAHADVVIAQLEVPLEIVRRAAAECSGLFLLNVSPAADVTDELIARCDVVIVNEHELAVAARTEAGVAQGHAALRSRGARAVVTTLGVRGAVVTDFDGVTTPIPAVPAPRVMDTTGAGDAFVGVLAARLAAGDPLTQAARWGTAAGSLAVRSPGTHNSYADAAAIHATLLPHRR